MLIIMIIASEISTICRPIGMPLTSRVRRITALGMNRAMSRRPSHSTWRLWRRYSAMASRAMACDTRVAQAEPAMPSAGKGPRPKISSGFSAISSTTASSRKRNGVRASPAPRRAALKKAKAYSSGMARKITRR